MTLLCLVLCACGIAAAHALQSTTSTVPERAALLSLVKQVASPAALFQTSKDDCRRVSEACEALERVAALDRPGFPRDLMLVDGRWRCIYTSAGVSVVPTPVLKLVGASPLGGLMPTRVEQRVDVRVVVAAAAAADVHDDGVEQVRVPVVVRRRFFGAGRRDGLLALLRVRRILDRRGALEGRRGQPEGHAQRRADLADLVPHVVVGEALEVEHDGRRQPREPQETARTTDRFCQDCFCQDN